MNNDTIYSNQNDCIIAEPETQDALYTCSVCGDEYDKNTVMRITDLSDNFSQLVCKHCVCSVIEETLKVQRENEVNPGVMIDTKF